MQSVIDDTVTDLPKLVDMTPEERSKWYKSLGTLERIQLNQVCGILMGLSLIMPIVEAYERMQGKDE